MKKTLKIKCTTPPGRLSFPHLVAPDQGRQYSDDKYKADLLVHKDTWKEQSATFVKAILDVAADYWGKKLTLNDFKHPLKDMDKDPKIDPKMQNHILIRAKTLTKPLIVNAQKKEMTEEEIKKLKGGDWARFVVVIAPYPQSGGGITAYLNAVQFWREGEAFGGGKEANLKMIDEMEVSLDEMSESGVNPVEENLDAIGNF